MNVFKSSFVLSSVSAVVGQLIFVFFAVKYWVLSIKLKSIFDKKPNKWIDL